MPPLRRAAVAHPDRTAEAVWVGLIAAALGWDIWLVRTDRRLLSDAARTPTGWCLQALLVAHFAGRLGRFDPFIAASRRIPRRTP